MTRGNVQNREKNEVAVHLEHFLRQPLKAFVDADVAIELEDGTKATFSYKDGVIQTSKQSAPAAKTNNPNGPATRSIT